MQSRVAACNGIGDNHSCGLGTLHTRVAELAVALAKVIKDPGSADAAGVAHHHLGTLLTELDRITITDSDGISPLVRRLSRTSMISVMEIRPAGAPPMEPRAIHICLGFGQT